MDTRQQLELITRIVSPEYKEGMNEFERFRSFHYANPHVAREITRRALRLSRMGIKKWNIANLFENMRWDYTIQTEGEEYKLNNNYKAFYSRLVMAVMPELSEFFTLRQQDRDWSEEIAEMAREVVTRE